MASGKKSYVVELVSGCKITEQRGVAFLICRNDESIDAKMTFEKLGAQIDRKVRYGLEHWIDGGRPNNKLYHGWDEDKNRYCFVFKWKERNTAHRLYGFLCNPLPQHPRFQLCVLVSHATKNQRETDPRELKRANELREDDTVRKAISKSTKDLKPSEKNKVIA